MNHIHWYPGHIAKAQKQLKEKFIFFIDDNLFSNEEEAKKLFEALIPLKKKWFCQISLDDIVIDYIIDSGFSYVLCKEETGKCDPF